MCLMQQSLKGLEGGLKLSSGEESERKSSYEMVDAGKGELEGDAKGWDWNNGEQIIWALNLKLRET